MDDLEKKPQNSLSVSSSRMTFGQLLNKWSKERRNEQMKGSLGQVFNIIEEYPEGKVIFGKGEEPVVSALSNWVFDRYRTLLSGSNDRDALRGGRAILEETQVIANKLDHTKGLLVKFKVKPPNSKANDDISHEAIIITYDGSSWGGILSYVDLEGSNLTSKQWINEIRVKKE